MGKWIESFEGYRDKLGNNNLTNVITIMSKYRQDRNVQYATMQATVPEIDSIIESVTSAFREFGGFEKELLPKNEDIPLPFDGNNLVAYLEALAQENGSEQYVEYLVARIRTMLSDTRMRSVTNDADNRIDLAK